MRGGIRSGEREYHLGVFGMQTLILLLLFQQTPAKNLKLLAPNTEMLFVMQNFNEALGVQCTYCHVQGDFASDANPKKDVARKMISMVRLIDTSFPSSVGNFPDGYHEVDCVTCHRGSVKPEIQAPSK